VETKDDFYAEEQLLFYSLGARWVCSMLGDPLENHWINVNATDQRVESISKKPAHSRAFYLGEESILLPATINAHTHLELSQIECPLNIPNRSITDWVAALLAFRRSPIYNAARGIQQAMHRPELLGSTAAVVDIVPPTLPPSILPNGNASPVKELSIRWLSFAELIAWRGELVTEKFAHPFSTFGLSPHAPHTVCLTLLEKALEQKMPIAMHLAETQEELQLLRQHTGPLLEMMRRADPDYNPKSVLIGKRPMDYLQLLSAAPSTLIIHGNYLDDEELRFLATHRERMSVVYCPRSHAYFRYDAYPLQKMLDYGVRVLLGTDSLASAPDLSLVNEIQFARQHHPTISAETLYRMGTWEGASALNLTQKGLGTLQPGSPAQFVMLYR
jgi:cytosine/adenosine deaminase-related metal-dependent hydrolase